MNPTWKQRKAKLNRQITAWESLAIRHPDKAKREEYKAKAAEASRQWNREFA